MLKRQTRFRAQNGKRKAKPLEAADPRERYREVQDQLN